MTTGTLEFEGTIDLHQFWPESGKTKNRFDSDADTVRVLIRDQGNMTFRFKGKGTRALNDAGFWHKDKKKKDKFTPVIGKDGIITIRLQGLDAPELHYQGYRQKMGETSTVQLLKFLNTHAANGIVRCRVSTRNIRVPNDVFDIYGRFVGEIDVISKKPGLKNLNNWLLSNGFAYPSFYDSMLNPEIERMSKLAVPPAKAPTNVWKYYANHVQAIDRTLRHKKTDNYDEKPDRHKPVLNPKIFRRLVKFEIQDKNKFTTQTFHDYLRRESTANHDFYYLKSDFLKSRKNAPHQSIELLVRASGKVTEGPQDVIYFEKPTHLKNSKKEEIASF